MDLQSFWHLFCCHLTTFGCQEEIYVLSHLLQTTFEDVVTHVDYTAAATRETGGLQRVYLTSVLSSALVKEYICRLYILLSIFYSALGKECARNFALVKTPGTRQTGGFS